MIENETPVHDGDIRWAEGKVRVRVGQRIGKSLTGAVFPSTSYQCLDDNDEIVYVEFKDLVTAEQALASVEAQAGILMDRAETAAEEAEILREAARQMRAKIDADDDARRGNPEAIAEVTRAFDAAMMNELPRNAQGYVVVRGVNLYGDEQPFQYVIPLTPKTKLELNMEPVEEEQSWGHLYGPEYLDRPPAGYQAEIKIKSGLSLDGSEKSFAWFFKVDKDD